MQRIAPGLVHMLDALYASIVVRLLNRRNVRDVVAIHDAFLVGESARADLRVAIEETGPLWLPHLGPFYDVFERYLLATSTEGKIVRQWRARWEQRVKDCESSKDTWPNFLTKPEGPKFQ